MPSRHHRTVDRITTIVEMTGRSPRGLTLAEIATRLEAPKSSVHQLVNGLVATGYLVETDRRFVLGPAPFVLALTGNRVVARELDHALLVRLRHELGCSLAVGVRVGDALIHVDYAGDEPALEFTARSHSRRSLYASASGKIVLVNLRPRERDELLLSAPREDEARVETFLAELPEIRETGLAYNRSATVPGIHAVATAYRGATDDFVASVCAFGRRELEPRLTEIGWSMQRFLAGHGGDGQ